MKLYKLTDEHNKTRGDTLWVPGAWREVAGTGALCGPGWLHAYESPLVAVLLNPIHADIARPRLWLAEGGGNVLRDGQCKIGVQRLRVIKRLRMPTFASTQRVAFGILCASKVCRDRAWLAWADGWISCADRSESAESAAESAAAARAESAESAAAWSAAWSAELDLHAIALAARRVK